MTSIAPTVDGLVEKSTLMLCAENLALRFHYIMRRGVLEQLDLPLWSAPYLTSSMHMSVMVGNRPPGSSPNVGNH